MRRRELALADDRTHRPANRDDWALRTQLVEAAAQETILLVCAPRETGDLGYQIAAVTSHHDDLRRCRDPLGVACRRRQRVTLEMEREQTRRMQVLPDRDRDARSVRRLAGL